ncbi:MAG: hypothetical protein HUJ72_09620 [Blautia sp.]|nr:hypothetical protein [Blautia sp.]
MEKLQPLHDQYAKIGWKAKKEKFAEEHAIDLKKYNSAFRLLKKFEATLPLDSKALRSEQKNLRKENAELTAELKAVQDQLEELKLVCASDHPRCSAHHLRRRKEIRSGESGGQPAEGKAAGRAAARQTEKEGY